MSDNKDNIIEESIDLYQENGQLTIFKSQDTYANMLKEKFVIPQVTTLEILDMYKLSEDLQKRAVNKLVDRTPHWLDLSEEEQLNEIKAVLTLETVANYLYDTGMIKEHCDLYENGFDKDGNIVLDAFYVNEKETLHKIKQEKVKKRQQRIIDFQEAKKKRGRKK